jgi:hypothetical protein
VCTGGKAGEMELQSVAGALFEREPQNRRRAGNDIVCRDWASLFFLLRTVDCGSTLPLAADVLGPAGRVPMKRLKILDQKKAENKDRLAKMGSQGSAESHCIYPLKSPERQREEIQYIL